MNIWSRTLLVLFSISFLAACEKPPVQQSQQQSSEPTVSAAVEQEPLANSASAISNEPESDCQLVMGFDVWEPYQYIGLGREVKGLDVEMVHLIAKRIGCDVTFKQDSWLNLLRQLREGDVDFVLGASITETRKQFAWFSDAYRQEIFQLYVRAEDQHKYRQATVPDFVTDGNRVGVIGAYFYGDKMSALMESERYRKQFVPAFMSEMNVVRLLDGDIDGFLDDSMVGSTMIRRKGLNRFVAEHQAKIKMGNVYVMFSQKSVSIELVKKFNRAMAVIKSNGQYDEIVQRYK
jgi:polar amino acid transport system substrate-binding protein